MIERPTEVRTVVLSGQVGRSLYRSARKLGLSGEAAINTLTDEIFKYDIDFNDDVGANDRFSVVVDQMWRDGELVGTGPVQAATFTVGGKLYSGFRFERNGKAEYFTADGRPLKRSFIRMPIPYARLTSTFGNRFHPILGRMRMHEGVDFAASTGTPIQAAGDARVQFVGWKGGYGRVVILDHGHGYTTLYGHMSRFGKRARRPAHRAGHGDRLRRHDRPGDRPAPALRIPRQRRAPQSAVDHDAAAGTARRRRAGAVPRADRHRAGQDPQRRERDLRRRGAGAEATRRGKKA